MRDVAPIIEQELRRNFPELTEDQIVRVKEIVVAHAGNNEGRLPSIEGIVRLVQSQPNRLTTNRSEEAVAAYSRMWRI